MAGLNLGITGQGQTVSSLAIAPGGIAEISGQATTGNYGALAALAGATPTLLTTTNQTAIATFTPPKIGLYLVVIYYELTSSTSVNITTSYASAGGSAVQETSVNNSAEGTGPHEVLVFGVVAGTGGPIQVKASVGQANVVTVTATIIGV